MGAKVYLTLVTGLGCLLPSQDSSLGSLIPWQVAIHSYLRSCLCHWGQGQGVLLGQQEKEKICKESLLHQEGGPPSAFSPVTAQTDLTAH